MANMVIHEAVHLELVIPQAILISEHRIEHHKLIFFC